VYELKKVCILCSVRPCLELYADLSKSRYDNACYLTMEKIMKKTFLASCLFVISGVAMAHGCPGEMKKIDAAMPTSKLSAQDASKVKDLRAKGEVQHNAGQHTESMQSLGEAKKIMGI
jgi:hypothetical protein